MVIDITEKKQEEKSNSAISHDTKKSQEMVFELSDVLIKHKCTPLDAVIVSRLFCDVCFNAHWTGAMAKQMAAELREKLKGGENASIKYVH